VPATPPWPPKSLPRLFVRQALSQWAQLELDGAAAHYLANVLRLKEGAQLLLFDGRSGEWLAKIVLARKNRLTVQV
jgi:16S rRNA (uracil1498-N3)-methyltransferase